MYLLRIVSRTLLLGLLATLLVLALSACGGAGGQEQANKPSPLPEVAKPLHPGEYRTEEFTPSFSFHVGKDWSMDTDPPEAPNQLELTWRKGTMNLFIMTIQEVYKPLTKTDETLRVQAPKDMFGWFQHHPYLKTSNLKPITIGGVKGEQFDVVVDVPKDYYGVCGSDGCLDIVAFDGWTESTGIPLAFVEGVKERVIVLDDVKGETVTIDFGAGDPGTKFDEYAPEGQKLVESIKWTAS